MANIDYHDDNITAEWINDIKYISTSPHPNRGRVNIFDDLTICLKDIKLFEI